MSGNHAEYCYKVPMAADLIREVHEAESSALTSGQSEAWGKFPGSSRLEALKNSDRALCWRPAEESLLLAPLFKEALVISCIVCMSILCICIYTYAYTYTDTYTCTYTYIYI